MGISTIQEQRDAIISTIRKTTRGDWKVLVVDEDSKKILDNVATEDDILKENITNIEQIENRRPMNPEMDAIYLLSPLPHIVDCLMADLERRRYKRAFLIWTSVLDGEHRMRIMGSPQNQQMIADMSTLTINFFPREQRLVTFRDPYSFPLLYHTDCNDFVPKELQNLAQKITGVCITLGEYPIIRYYRPQHATHEASVMCSWLARFVQEELDTYKKFNLDWPPQSTRPQGVLVLTDRSMDLVAPIIHEFTYQSMAHDLLPIKENDKVTYRTTINEGKPDQEEKDVEITEKDDIWVKYRHEHMANTIERLSADFRKFIADNPHFTRESEGANVNAIKDMLAGLPQFTSTKEAYSLHLTMMQDCMEIFNKRKLREVSLLEQILATGLDDEYRKPKNVADQLVRLLDDSAVSPQDRLRLIMLYVIFKDGIVLEDIPRLLQHSQLPLDNQASITNMENLGAHATRALKEKRPHPQPLFPPKTQPAYQSEEYSISRFEPAVKQLLDRLQAGTLDQTNFPYYRPPPQSELDLQAQGSSSLRSAKPTWARNRQSMHEAKQRIIVFMAGGATYSEAKAVYDASQGNKDCVLVTSHMLTPAGFVRQCTELGFKRGYLNLPQDRPRRKAPDWIFEREAPKPAPQPRQAHGLTSKMGGLHLSHGGSGSNGAPMQTQPQRQPQRQPLQQQAPPPASSSGKLEKKPKEEKKKRGFFSSKKKDKD